jgi:hypothetical protein
VCIVELDAINELLYFSNFGCRGNWQCLAERMGLGSKATLIVELPKVWVVRNIHEVETLLLQTELFAFGDTME